MLIKMRAPLCALLAVLLAAFSACADDVSPSILNGVVAKPGRFNYIVNIRNAEGKYSLCSGVLVAPDVVLTLANCMYRDWGGAWPEVWLGSYQINTCGQFCVKRKTVAMAWKTGFPFDNKDGTYANDVALFLLDRPITRKNISPVQLPGATLPGANTNLTVAGWGPIKAGSEVNSWALRTGTLRLRTQEQCKRIWKGSDDDSVAKKDWDTTRIICAKFARAGQALCTREWGAPLVLQGKTAKDDVLIGIGTDGECTAATGGVFFNAARNAYWIRQGIRVLHGKSSPNSDQYVVAPKATYPEGCGGLPGDACYNGDSSCCSGKCGGRDESDPTSMEAYLGICYP